MKTDRSGRPFTERFVEALQYAATLHRDQKRKGPEQIPYIGHLLIVAGTVIANGADVCLEVHAIASRDRGCEEQH